jgi:hypothetical protein
MPLIPVALVLGGAEMPVPNDSERIRPCDAKERPLGYPIEKTRQLPLRTSIPTFLVPAFTKFLGTKES